MSELTREQIEALQAGGPGWCGTESFNTLCNMALRFALFEQLGRDGVWDSHGNSGMRYPEESDLSGGATDCAAPDVPPLACLDCGTPYSSLELDTTLPDEQWRMIHDSEGGILCASCIVRRASRLDGIVACRMRFEFAGAAPDVEKVIEELESRAANVRQFSNDMHEDMAEEFSELDKAICELRAALKDRP